MRPFRETQPSDLTESFKRVPAEPLPEEPKVPSLIDRITAELRETTGHDTDMDVG